MKGDFSRYTYDASEHFSRVLMQQGRVQLDADWNEQVAILLDAIRVKVTDTVGPHGTPQTLTWLSGDPEGSIEDQSFKIEDGVNNFMIHRGHYYVNGILCENIGLPDDKGNITSLPYDQQSGFPFPDSNLLFVPKGGEGFYLVYLDVWERHINYIEDEKIREIALNGPDTTTRAKVVWQVKLVSIDKDGSNKDYKGEYLKKFIALLKSKDVRIYRPGTGLLKARTRDYRQYEISDPCILSPEAGYRGAENQLYRVEIHQEGLAREATFKWSRENGSVVFSILDIDIDSASETTVVRLGDLGRDSKSSLKRGDWVEIVDDDYILRNHTDTLLEVESVYFEGNTVTLKGISNLDYGTNQEKHPLLRRWEGWGSVESENQWIDLEDGVNVSFVLENPVVAVGSGSDSQLYYHTGDFWTIPARTINGCVIWPQEDKDGNLVPKAKSAHGVIHHYAPLSVVSVDVSGKVSVVNNGDCRRIFKKAWS